jgi:hypothetical protein
MSDTKTKSRIGFRTTAVELQDKFEEVFSKVQLTEDNWDDLGEMWKNMSENLVTWRGAKSSKEFRMLLSILELSSVIGRMLAVTGKQLSKIEKRVAACEKSIEKLHLKAK